MKAETPPTPFQKRLESIGDAKAAEQLGVKVRTVQSWRLGDRKPRPAQARDIISRWPVTLEDIYVPVRTQQAEYEGPDRRKQAA